MSISKNLAIIRKNITAAISNNNRNVKLVAVTKTQSPASIREAIAAGITTIGENRVQEALEKYPVLTDNPEWHLIGHLQTNKVRQAVALFDLIQSVDSERLLIEINNAAAKINKCQNILIQVNIAEEESKFGILSGQLWQLVNVATQLENINLCGLMTIAPFYSNPESARPIFRELFFLFQELKSNNLKKSNIEWLSMGMTNDYIIALEEGANIIRIGTGIFGIRQ